MPPKIEYPIGTHVVCQHNGMPYEAKIIDIKDLNGPDARYVVHYQGWNSRYDEEIPFSDAPVKLSEATEETIAAAKMAKEMVSSSKKKRIRPGNFPEDVQSESGSRCSSPSASSVKSRGNKRKTPHSPALSLSEEKPTIEVNITIPKSLNQVLIDDHDLVSKNYLSKLPARFTVDMIIKEYIATLGSKNPEQNREELVFFEYGRGRNSKLSTTSVECSIMGLADYFNCLLPNQLLYKFERRQYTQLNESEKAAAAPEKPEKTKRGKKSAPVVAVVVPDIKPTKYYGLPHFLRLLNRLPSILKMSTWNDRVLNDFIEAVHDLLVFLNKSNERYTNYEEDYEVASTEYYRTVNTI